MIVFILCLDISIFVVIWWSYIILCSCDYSLFVFPWVNITKQKVIGLKKCKNMPTKQESISDATFKEWPFSSYFNFAYKDG